MQLHLQLEPILHDRWGNGVSGNAYIYTYMQRCDGGCVRVRLLGVQEVASSSLATPTKRKSPCGGSVTGTFFILRSLEKWGVNVAAFADHLQMDEIFAAALIISSSETWV